MNFNQKINLNIEVDEVLFIKSGFKNAASKFGICLNNLPIKRNLKDVSNCKGSEHFIPQKNFNSTSLMKGGYLKWTKLANSNKWVPLIKIESEKPVVINKNFTRQIFLNKLDRNLFPNLKIKMANSLSTIKLEKKDSLINKILNQSISDNNLVLDNQESKSIIDGNEKKIVVLSASSLSSSSSSSIMTNVF